MTPAQGVFPEIIPAPRPPLPLDEAFAGVRFQLLLADPPWLYQNWSEAKNGSHRPHYSSPPLEVLEALPVPAVAAKDSVLLLWATGPKLPEAIQLMEAWRFRYVTVLFVWHKRTCNGLEAVGPGWHTKPSAELVLLGKRGRGLTVASRRVRQVFEAQRRGHSVKPEEFYSLVDELYGAETGPRLELFARRSRRGWHVWGDEVGPWAEAGA